MRENHRQGGFTLIELMIVVSIIAVISAVAIPHLLAARINANEAAALSSLRTICSASALYLKRHAQYPGSISGDGLADLSDPALRPAPFIDQQLGAGRKSGYLFLYHGGLDLWNCTATPEGAEVGVRSFYVDQSGVIRVETDFVTNGPATAGNPPMQ